MDRPCRSTTAWCGGTITIGSTLPAIPIPSRRSWATWICTSSEKAGIGTPTAFWVRMNAFTENFMLPFSHDEVVHGKGSMLTKMPGDEWQRHANLRLLYAYQFSHPGKKLLFMGTEFAQGLEWNNAGVLDWYVLDYPLHRGMQRLVKDLNHLYRTLPAFHRYEFDWQGFEWIDCNDAGQSVISFLRKGDEGEMALVVVNLTPVPRHDYRIGVPLPGRYLEVLNSDAACYGGSDLGNGSDPLQAETIPWMSRSQSLALTLPPLAAIVLQHNAIA